MTDQFLCFPVIFGRLGITWDRRHLLWTDGIIWAFYGLSHVNGLLTSWHYMSGSMLCLATSTSGSSCPKSGPDVVFWRHWVELWCTWKSKGITPQKSDEASQWSLFGLFGDVWSLSGNDGSGQIHWQLAASISGFGFFCIISLVWKQVRNWHDQII